MQEDVIDEVVRPWSSLCDRAPLRGVRVLSLAQQLPGPYAGMLLGELGAEVILVEQVAKGDPARRNTAFFESVNRGKRSIAIDLKQGAGVEVMRRLTMTSRVVLEGFRPGVAQRLGVDFGALREARPDLIYCSLSGYGQDGQDRLTPAHDLSCQARAAGITPGDPHVEHVGYAVSDMSGALYAALAVTSALLTDGPVYIDLSLADSALAFQGPDLETMWSRGPGVPPVRDAAYGVFNTADGWITVSIHFEDHFWRALCDALGLDEYRNLTWADRAAATTHLHNVIANRLEQLGTNAALELLVTAGVPAGRVNTPWTVHTDPLFRARGMIVEDDGCKRVRTPLSRESTRPDPAAPQLGADTLDLLQELGIDVDEADRFVDAGVVGVPSTPGTPARYKPTSQERT